MLMIALPRLAGTREAADKLLDAQLAGHDSLHTEKVVLVCRDVITSTASFADQLVERILKQGKAAELVLLAPSSGLQQHIMQAAEDRGVGDRVHVDTATALGV